MVRHIPPAVPPLMKLLPRILRPLAVVLCLASVAGAPRVAQAQAQASQGASLRLSYATRAQLDSMVRAADDAAAAAPAGSDVHKARRAEAEELRQRLDRGDFTTGDRVIVRVAGQPAMSDTFTVRDGTRLSLPGIPDVSLQGVLRSEAQQRVRAAVANFYRDPEVAVVPLLRVSVTGSVQRSGFYALPADLLLSDAIMAAGGPTNAANLQGVELRRGDKRLYSSKQFSSFLRQGYSLDQVHVRAGDEIHVGERRRNVWPMVLQGLAAVGAIVTLTTALQNRR